MKRQRKVNPLTKALKFEAQALRRMGSSPGRKSDAAESFTKEGRMYTSASILKKGHRPKKAFGSKGCSKVGYMHGQVD